MTKCTCGKCPKSRIEKGLRCFNDVSLVAESIESSKKRNENRFNNPESAVEYARIKGNCVVKVCSNMGWGREWVVIPA